MQLEAAGAVCNSLKLFLPLPVCNMCHVQCVCDILVCTIWVMRSAVLVQLCTAGVVLYIQFVGVCLFGCFTAMGGICVCGTLVKDKIRYTENKVYIVVMFSIASYCNVSCGTVPYPVV